MLIFKNKTNFISVHCPEKCFRITALLERATKSSIYINRKEKHTHWLPDMLEVVLLCMVVPGRALWAWAEQHSPGAWDGIHILAALMWPGMANTGNPEAARVLLLAAGGTAEEW